MTGASVFGGGDPTKGRNVRTLTTQAAMTNMVTPNLVRSISAIGVGGPTKERNAGIITTLDVMIVMPTPEPSQRTHSLIGVGAFTKA
jgi:hypothetical protein